MDKRYLFRVMLYTYSFSFFVSVIFIFNSLLFVIQPGTYFKVVGSDDGQNNLFNFGYSLGELIQVFSKSEDAFTRTGAILKSGIFWELNLVFYVIVIVIVTISIFIWRWVKQVRQQRI